MKILLIAAIVIWNRACHCDDFDVALIGFDSDDYGCSDDAESSQRNAKFQYPSLTWHKRETGLVKNGESHDACIWKSRANGRISIVDKLIKDIIVNATAWRRGAHLVCVAVSSLYTPVISWKAIGNVRSASIILTDTPAPPLRPACDQKYKTISVLKIDRSSVYQCRLDTTETCSIRNQCERKLLLERSMHVADGGSVNGTWSSFKCGTVANGICANMTSSKSRMTAANLAINNIDQLVHKMQPRSKSDLERLCFLLFPLCADTDSSTRLIPLCREDCYILQYRYWQHWPNLANYAAAHFPRRRWVGCGQLPSVLDEGASCARVTRKEFNKEKLNEHCYKEYDRHYVGNVSQTPSGHVCQRWDSLCPHHHDYWPELYPELRGAENHCRNPNGVHPRPWCYTMDPAVRIAYCDIARCQNQQPMVEGADGSAVVAVSVCAVLLLSICAIIMYGYKRKATRNKLRRHSMANADRVWYRSASQNGGLIEDAVTFGDELDGVSGIPQNELYFRNEWGFDRRLEPLEVPRSSWTVVQRLASGDTNDVFLARLHTNDIDFLELTDRRSVVVKTLKDPSQQYLLESFMQEALVVASCRHDRIVRLLGVCFVTEPTCILFEYLPLGDLKSILRSESCPDIGEIDAFFEQCRRTWKPPLGHWKRQLDICRQILDGMVYLTKQRIVHRDLAARNILVDEKLRIKISDFGLSKRVDRAGGVFVACDGERFPVRWTAPEVWSERTFSSKSDVWSFGVVVWEILSMGMQPYIGLSHQEVVNLVANLKVTLKTPVNVDGAGGEAVERISNGLMQPCFAYEPRDRPDFTQLFSEAARLVGCLVRDE